MKTHTCEIGLHDRCYAFVGVEVEHCQCPCHDPTGFMRALRQKDDWRTFHRDFKNDAQWYLHRALLFMQNGIFPGGGKQHAKFVREVCEKNGWREDDYLPSFITKNKKAWGL